MKQFLLFFLSIVIFSACSGTKNTQKALNTGNYDLVINKAIQKLSANKTSKKKQPYVIMLEESFAKAAARDQNAISFLTKENNPAKFEKIYKTYVSLKKRQERIKPLLPLYKMDKGKNANFNFNNYDNEIINYRIKVSDYLYNNAVNALGKSLAKQDYRNVYDDLSYLNSINPSYKNTVSLINEAHNKGIDFVYAKMTNESDKVIPKKLEDELLNLDTYGLDNLWTVYHTNKVSTVNYDYTMYVELKRIIISPEKVTERQLVREKIVVDGWEYAVNEEGEILKDAEGEKIKVDTTKKVVCEYYEFTQFKSVAVKGQVKFINNASKQLVNSFPLESQFVFEHVYANYSGDKRALGTDLTRYLGLQSVTFPSNEQMIYDSGEDLKLNLKAILTRQQF